MQDAVIYEFLNNEQQQKDCHFIFSVWNLPEHSEDQAPPYEDEEDEDNGLAQSLAVTTQASRSAEQVEQEKDQRTHKRFWSSSSEPDNKRKARENFDEDIAQTRRRTGSWH